MQRLIWLIFIAVMAFNCGGDSNNAAQEEASTTNNEEAPVSTEKTPDAEIETADAIINPNLATKEDLQALPQVDENLAQQILDGRPYLNMTDFYQVIEGSIEEGNLETFLASCFVPLNLNTSPEEEFLMVPGVGKKMAHEFEEYRPYKKVAQFRREMGKYVDDAEIARYEKFVFVPVALNAATEEEILALPGVGKKIAHEFEEYRPYKSMEQFRREIGKYVDEKELARLERFVYLDTEN